MKTTITEKSLIKEDHWHKDEFEIVDKFPDNYVVWAIGRENHPFPGYLPLARPGDQHHTIRRTDLKTLKVDEKLALHVMTVAIRGEMGEIDKSKFEKIAKGYHE